MLESDGQDFKDFLGMDYDHILARVPRTIFRVLLVEICLRMIPTNFEVYYTLMAHTGAITAIFEMVTALQGITGSISKFG